MNSVCAASNTFLILCALCLASPAGAKEKKEAATLRVHLESPAAENRTEAIKIPRENPAVITIEKNPILTEFNVSRAEIVPEVDGGFTVKVHFDRRGTWLLENYTASYPGRRFAIHGAFGPSRWLGAPVISRRVANGILQFTPDASREEAERFIRGLNRTAAKIQKREKF